MQVEFIQPFALAAMHVLEAELGAGVERGKLSVQHEEFTTQEVTVLIGITGQVEGSVLYGTKRETVNRMVSVMMGESHEEFDDTSRSAIAELGNVISGQAAALFEQQGVNCSISPPNLIVGEGTQLSSVGIPRLIIPLNTELGVVELAVSLRDKTTRSAS